MVLGFSLKDAQPEMFPVQADDDVEIPDDSEPIQGAEIPEGRIVVQPMPEDEVNVNGTILRENSSLAALRTGCSFYNPFQHRDPNQSASSVLWSTSKVWSWRWLWLQPVMPSSNRRDHHWRQSQLKFLRSMSKLSIGSLTCLSSHGALLA